VADVSSTRSRAVTIPLIAGRPVLDLVNTVSWRGEPSRSEDHLQDASDCLTWSVRAGVLSDAEAGELARRLGRHSGQAEALTAGLHDLRTAVAATFASPTTASVEHLEPLILEALAHSHLVPGGHGGADRDRYDWAVRGLDLDTPRQRLTLDLLDLLNSPHGRIGVCADTACQWVFLDASRAQNRQWCSSKDCGNRHRVRRHQRRRAHAT
jgi:predicted RNA-binding Zn ribbon-like protein